MEIRVTKSTTVGQKTRPQDSQLGFGKYTTDHMFLMDYTIQMEKDGTMRELNLMVT